MILLNPCIKTTSDWPFKIRSRGQGGNERAFCLLFIFALFFMLCLFFFFDFKNICYLFFLWNVLLQRYQFILDVPWKQYCICYYALYLLKATLHVFLCFIFTEINIVFITIFILGDSLSYHNGMKYTTKDEDNDKSQWNCATIEKGAWWYNAFYYSHLNGQYANSAAVGGQYLIGLNSGRTTKHW